MSYQVVSPRTGEIAAIFSSEGEEADKNFMLAMMLCDELHGRDGEQWDVIHIEVAYSVGEENGSESRSSRADS
jgi:hypothetical protein